MKRPASSVLKRPSRGPVSGAWVSGARRPGAASSHQLLKEENLNLKAKLKEADLLKKEEARVRKEAEKKAGEPALAGARAAARQGQCCCPRSAGGSGHCFPAILRPECICIIYIYIYIYMENSRIFKARGH